MLTSALLFLFNMARGQAAISHSTWLVIAAWVVYCDTHDFLQTTLWMFIIIVVTIRATKPLLAGINGEKRAIWDGFVRNAPIIPVLWALGNWWGLALLGQGLIYYLVGKWNDGRSTRLAEGITGILIGVCI